MNITKKEFFEKLNYATVFDLDNYKIDVNKKCNYFIYNGYKYEFYYKNELYKIKYFDGCFSPFLIKIIK